MLHGLRVDIGDVGILGQSFSQSGVANNLPSPVTNRTIRRTVNWPAVDWELNNSSIV